MSDEANSQSPNHQHVPDGAMRISKATMSETIRLQQFLLEQKGVMLNEIMLEVEYNTSTFAIAAMLKGLEEFYFKPAGLKGEGQMLAQSEHNLKLWEEINQKAQSRIIVP